MSEWISVEDRLPPKDCEKVLVFFRDGGADVWAVGGEPERLKGTYGHLTHWMPLPEPPNAE